MMRLFLPVFMVVMIFSCNQNAALKFNKCRYSKDMLFASFDSSMFEWKKYENDALFEVVDKGSDLGVRGIYKFDNNGTLRFYGFLLSDSNDYIFSTQYDSLGKIEEKTDGEVVQWYFRKVGEDSVKVTFYLFNLNKTYSDIVLTLGEFKVVSLDIFTSPIFSNITGGSLILPMGLIDTISVLKVKGTVRNICSDETYSFSDSALNPFKRTVGGNLSK